MIGINSQIETGGGGNGNVGIGFAIPINTAREVANQIEQNGKVEHAYLGISGGTITPELAKALNLPVDEGVLVAEAVKGGPAAEAGIKGGDTEATIEGAERHRSAATSSPSSTARRSPAWTNSSTSSTARSPATRSK